MLGFLSITWVYPLAVAPIVRRRTFEAGLPAGRRPVRAATHAVRLCFAVESYRGRRRRRAPRPELEVAAVSESFHVSSESSDGSYRVIASGELDIATVPVLEEAFDEALAAEAARIVVDLGGVTFIDSTGLRLLIRMNETCADGTLAIRSTAIVDRLLQVTGLLDQLPLLVEDDA